MNYYKIFDLGSPAPQRVKITEKEFFRKAPGNLKENNSFWCDGVNYERSDEELDLGTTVQVCI